MPVYSTGAGANAAATAIVFDASGAEAGARQAVAAAESIKAANRDVVASTERVLKSTAETGAAYGRLQRAIDPVGAAQQRLARAIELVDNELLRGRIAGDEHADMLRRVSQHYDGLIDRARQAAKSQQDFAIATERARQAAENAQRAMNQLLNVNPGAGAGSARASAAVFEEQARAQEEAARAAAQVAAANDNLRAKYVPLHAVQQQYLAQLAEIRAAGSEVFRTEAERAAALGRTKAAFAEQVRAINGTGEALRTGMGRYRQMGAAVQQAGYQVGDFAVQVASGQGVLRPFIQQGTQLISMFGPWGAVIGAAGAVIGALAVSLWNTEEAEDAVSRATGTTRDAMDDYRATLEATDAASKGAAVSTRDLEASLDAVGTKAVEAALKVEEELQKSLRRQIEDQRRLMAAQQGDSDVISPDDLQALQRAGTELGVLSDQFDASADRSAELFTRLGLLRDAIETVTGANRLFTTAQEAVNRSIERATELAEAERAGREAASDRAKALLADRDDYLAGVDREIRQQGILTAALAAGTRAHAVAAKTIEIMNAQTLIGETAARRLAERIVASTRAFEREKVAIDLRNQAVARATELADDETKARIDASDRAKDLLNERDTYLAGVDREIRQQGQLTAAIGEGGRAYRVAAKSLEIMNDQVLIGQDEAQRLAERIIDSEDAFARAQAAGEEVGNFLGQTFDRVGSAITEAFAKGEISAAKFGDIARAVSSEVLQWFVKLSLINPLKNALEGGGTLPTLGSVFGSAAAAAGGQSGGSSTGGIFDAISGIGNAISSGFSSVTTGISSFLFGTAPGAAAAAGVAPVIGGMTNAGTAGLFGTFGAGASTFASLAGPIAAIAAIAIPLLTNLFSGPPSSGPVGIADFAPGLGRGREFEQPLIDPFTSDNGGNAEGMRPIAEAIADVIANAADRFEATIDQRLRFRVANYASPESGSGRSQGFEVNAFLADQIEMRIAEGLTQEQAIFESLRFAVQEAFTFQSATLAEIAANTKATNTEDLLADLEFGRHFDMLTAALAELGGEVNANTLAAAQLEVAILDQAEEFAKGAVTPILEALERALELFPGEVTRETTSNQAVRGVYSPGNIEGGGGRWVAEGTDEFDRLTAGDGGLTVVTRMEEVADAVTGQAENYAANMQRVADSIGIARASVELLVEQITGEFEPAVRGPFQEALEQGVANIRALAPEFEAVNDQITAAYEQFPELKEQLGGLADVLIDVTGTIDTAIDALREQLKQDFKDSVQADINAATGLGRINDLNTLITGRGTRAADATAFGLDVNEYAGEWFDAVTRNLFEGSSLAELNRILTSGQVVDEGALAILNAVLAEKALAAVRQDEIDGLRKLEDATDRFAKAANDNARNLRQAAASLLVDRNLSPLSGLERLREGQRQLEEAYAVANDDDPTDAESQAAIARLPDLVRTADELARDYYASSAGYSQQFNRGQEILNSTALRQESIEQQMLGKLSDIHAAILAAGGSNDNLTAAQQAAARGFDFGANPAVNQQIYNALAAAGLQTPAAFGGGQLNALRASNPAVHAIVSALGYHAGGIAGDIGMTRSVDPAVFAGAARLHGGGLAGGGLAGWGGLMPGEVPTILERGEEVLTRTDPRHRFNLAANDGGGETAGAVRALHEEVRALRQEVVLLREVAAQSGNLTVAATREVASSIDRGRRDGRQLGGPAAGGKAAGAARQ